MCSFLLKLVLQVVKFLLHGEQRIIRLFRCQEHSIVASLLVPQRPPALPVSAPKPDVGFGKEDGRIDWVGSNPPALIPLVPLHVI